MTSMETTNTGITETLTVERALRLIAGVLTLASVLLGYYYTPLWFLFTGFISINLIQSAFTDWCPMMTFLGWCGFKREARR